jgi:prolipoprotein diacylglyceryltransferase
MIINEIKFPIYMTFILLSFILACIFIYIYLKKQNIDKKDIRLYISMIIPFGLIGSFLVCYLIDKDMGLSSYVGCFMLIITSLFYEHINPSKNNYYVKSTILSLPLIYGVSKLGCFFVGCCYGRGYNGILSVTYTSGLNISLFPVQLLESIVFILIFLILLLIHKKRKINIISLTIIVCALSKFILDFLRYDHLTKIITTNQIISLILVLIIIVNYIRVKLIKK